MAVAIPLRRGARPLDAGALTAALYRDHAAELLRFAWHRLGRIEDAEDAVQTTFLSAHRVLQEGEEVREPRAWLFRILRNECLTRIAMTKRRGVHEELGEWHADVRAGVHEQMASNDEFDTAVALLATLPVQQREAMVLREWLGMTASETAEVLDVTPQGVDALVYRARRAIVGLEEVEAASTCGEVRGALADARVTASIRAHLLACRGCRAAARRLHAPEELAAAHGLLPLDAIASRIGESIPGFLGAGATAAAIGGGAVAATAIAGGTAVKVAAAVAIGAVVAGGAVRGAPALERAFDPPKRDSGTRAVASTATAAAPTSADGAHRIVSGDAQTGAGAADAPTRGTAPSHPTHRPGAGGASAAGGAVGVPPASDAPSVAPAPGGSDDAIVAPPAVGAASAADDEAAASATPPSRGEDGAGGASGRDPSAGDGGTPKPPRADDGEPASAAVGRGGGTRGSGGRQHGEDVAGSAAAGLGSVDRTSGPGRVDAGAGFARGDDGRDSAGDRDLAAGGGAMGESDGKAAGSRGAGDGDRPRGERGGSGRGESSRGDR